MIPPLLSLQEPDVLTPHFLTPDVLTPRFLLLLRLFGGQFVAPQEDQRAASIGMLEKSCLGRTGEMVTGHCVQRGWNNLHSVGVESFELNCKAWIRWKPPPSAPLVPAPLAASSSEVHASGRMLKGFGEELHTEFQFWQTHLPARDSRSSICLCRLKSGCSSPRREEISDSRGLFS